MHDNIEIDVPASHVVFGPTAFATVSVPRDLIRVLGAELDDPATREPDR